MIVHPPVDVQILYLYGGKAVSIYSFTAVLVAKISQSGQSISQYPIQLERKSLQYKGRAGKGLAGSRGLVSRHINT